MQGRFWRKRGHALGAAGITMGGGKAVYSAYLEYTISHSRKTVYLHIVRRD